MAWAEKYRLEFNDTYGVLWTRKIYEDGFGGSKTDLTGTGEPLRYEFLSDSDEFDEPIRETRGNSGVYAMTDFALEDLYSTEKMQFLVEDYCGVNLYFKGYVSAGNCEEPYDDVPYPVSISAVCGLNYLKDIKYDNSGTYYSGHKFISEIILDILAKIGFTTFTEYVNIYEASMNDGQADSPFDQTMINVDIFRDMYCSEVLAEVLRPFAAVIRQVNGEFCIYRPVELTGATVYGRSFTGSTTKTGVSITPQSYINRSTNPSNIIQVPGSIKMNVDPMSKVTYYFNTGYLDSWLTNWDFKAGTYDPVSYVFEGWTNKPGMPVTTPAAIGIPDELDGVVLFQSTLQYDRYIYQSFGTYALDTTDVFFFSFDYLFYLYTANIIGLQIYAQVKADGGNYWLSEVDKDTAEWVGSNTYITIDADVPEGISGWYNWGRRIAGIPIDGTYTVTLYATYKAGAPYSHFVAYKNVRFYCTSDIISSMIRPHKGPFPNLARKILGLKKYIKTFIDVPEIASIEYSIDNSLNGGLIDKDLFVGDVVGTTIDNVIEQFAGALVSNVTVLQNRVDKITLSGTSGDADIICNGVSRTASCISSLTQAASDFASAFAADYLPDVIVTSSGPDIIFTGAVAGDDFTGSTTITNTSGDLSGSVVNFTPASVTTIDYTTEWNTRGGSEASPLLQIVANEVADQYSRPKQLIQMAMIDINASANTIGLLKRFEDDLNKYSGNNRKFVVNAGEFVVKTREWELDLMEVI